jgi:Flp pilus assembly protein TadB
MDRWLWLCPLFGLAAAALTLSVFGFTWLSALGIAFLVACPALVVWTLRESKRTLRERQHLLEELRQERSERHG